MQGLYPIPLIELGGKCMTIAMMNSFNHREKECCQYESGVGHRHIEYCQSKLIQHWLGCIAGKLDQTELKIRDDCDGPEPGGEPYVMAFSDVVLAEGFRAVLS
jgi:hypothetical protein